MVFRREQLAVMTWSAAWVKGQTWPMRADECRLFILVRSLTRLAGVHLTGENVELTERPMGLTDADDR